VPNINQNHIFLNISADIIHPQFYTFRHEQVLRRIQFTKDENKYNHKVLKLPYYFLISRKDFETITVSICNDQGRSIVFDRENTFMLLHVREKLNGNDFQNNFGR